MNVIPRGERNPWLIGWIGSIAVVLCANATLVVLAIATQPGLVNPDYYERGRRTERTIVSRAAAAPDWTLNLDIPADLRARLPATIRFVAVDRRGQPVTPEAVTFFAYRPADATRDFSLPMQAEGRGRYAARVTFPLPGVWDTLVAARQNGAEHTFSQRVVVAQP